MFKDLYKKANDAIPTEDAYLRVTEKVNRASKKPETIKYSYGRIAALAACFILTVSLISVYEKPSQTIEEPVTPVIVRNISEPDVTQEPTKAPETTAPRVASEITQEPATPVTEAPAYVKNQGIPEGIGVAVAKFSLGEAVTEEAYFEYLGKNVTEGIVLPEGIENQSAKEHILTLTEGEEFNDRWTFYFAGGEATVFVTTTKSLETVLGIVENQAYQKSKIEDTDVVIFEEGEERIACFFSGDIGYTVSSYGVLDEDFEKLIASLIK